MKTLVKSVFIVFALVLVNQPEALAKKEVKEIKILSNPDCNHCKEKLEHNLKFEKGVTTVNVDIKTKYITISYRPDKTNPDKLRQAISKLGYNADDIKAQKKDEGH